MNEAYTMRAQFDEAIESCFGPQMLVDEEVCKRVYAAITNIIWVYKIGTTNKDGYLDYEEKEVSISFRTAGGLVAEILGEGGYLDWYCSAPEGVVDDNIADALRLKGWIWKEWPSRNQT